MVRHPRRPNSIRHPNHDYRGSAAYHVTLCTSRRRSVLSQVCGQRVALTDIGRIVTKELRRTFELRPYAVLVAYVIMPDHIHMLVRIRGDQPLSRELPRLPRGPQRRSLSSLVGAFKSASSRAVRRAFPSMKGAIWQRGYHDNIIRNDDAFAAVMRYIALNPLRWTRHHAMRGARRR